MVHQVGTVSEALAWMSLHTPALIITDLCIPDTDGLSMLKLARAEYPDIPVIVVSGMGVVRDVVEALRHGAADYLLKPLVDMEVLVHSVNRALERSQLLDENQRYREKLEHANRELEEYVRLLEHDQQAGRRVQKKLMPKTPLQLGNISVSYRIIPSLYLSGDFIDYGLVADRYLAFYLTDVSGHGAAPAFVTVWLKQLVRRVFREHNIFQTEQSFQRDAGNLLKLINGEIIHSGVGCHLTCFVGIIDTHTLEMRYVVAGHLPLPILVVGSRAEYLEGKGKPLGIFKDAEWTVSSIQLPQNFSLIIFSDGVLEVLPPEQLIEKEEDLLKKVADQRSVLASEPSSAVAFDELCRKLDIEKLETVPDDVAILKISGSAGSSCQPG